LLSFQFQNSTAFPIFANFAFSKCHYMNTKLKVSSKDRRPLISPVRQGPCGLNPPSRDPDSQFFTGILPLWEGGRILWDKLPWRTCGLRSPTSYSVNLHFNNSYSNCSLFLFSLYNRGLSFLLHELYIKSSLISVFVAFSGP